MQENATPYFTKFLSAINLNVSRNKKLINILKWADEKHLESFQDTHPALGRMLALRTLLNIDKVLNQLKPNISNKDRYVAEKLAGFLL